MEEGSVFASCMPGVGNVSITGAYRAVAVVLCSSSEKVSLESRKESRLGQTGGDFQAADSHTGSSEEK